MESLLFTGGTGYLGHNIRAILDQTYHVTTIGITDSDEIKANFVSEVPSLPTRYDIVLHAAGKAHTYPKTEAERQAFFDVNYHGTIHLCQALETVGTPKSFIFISTMAVYGSDGSSIVTEDHPLNGFTPYAKSKIMAEQYLMDWCKEHGLVLTILRPSLLVGPNPPGNLGAMINGIKKHRYLSIGGGRARKSFLMVYDIARVIPELSTLGGIYNICADDSVSYRQLEELICKQLGMSLPVSIPFWLAKCMAIIGDFIGRRFPINSRKLTLLTRTSLHSNAKIRATLHWKPLDILDNFVIAE